MVTRGQRGLCPPEAAGKPPSHTPGEPPPPATPCLPALTTQLVHLSSLTPGLGHTSHILMTRVAGSGEEGDFGGMASCTF